MKTILNSVVAWLRTLPSINETNLKKIEIENGVTSVALVFPDEQALAAFGSTHLSNSVVIKTIAGGEVCYTASVEWRKRTIKIFLFVSAEVPRPAAEVFSSNRN